MTEQCVIQKDEKDTELERRARLRPLVDISESDSDLLLTVDLPGADEDGVEASVDDRVLTIRARSSRSVPEGYRVLRRELCEGDFERRFELHSDIDVEGIEAELHLGVLELRLPKKQPGRRKIEIRSSAILDS